MFKKFTLLAIASFFTTICSWGQTPNGYLNFGTTANGTTASTGNTGFSGVRVGTGGGSFTIMNSGQAIGTDAEIRGIAPTTASINSIGIASSEYGTAAQTFTVSFEVHLSGGSSGTWYFFAGNGTSFAAAQSSGFTGSQVFTGLRWTFGSGSTITTANRAAGTWTDISGTPFAQNTAYNVTIVGNNSASTVNYDASNTVAANTYDMWVNGSLVGDDLAKAQLAAATNINAFRFYSENSTGNVAQIALDNIRWFNTCALPTYTWNGSVDNNFATAANWTPTRTTMAVGDILSISSSSTITDIPTQSIARLNVTGGSSVSLNAATAGNILTITGASSNALNVVGGSTLTIGAANALNLTATTASTLAGNLTLGAATSTTTFSGALSLGGTLNINGANLSLGGAVTGAGTLRGSHTSNLTINGAVGTINFDGTTDGNHLNPTSGTNSLNNLTLTGSGSVTLGNKVNLYGDFDPANGTSLNSGTNLLVFRSTATRDARIVNLTGRTVTLTGTVVQERYLHRQARAWRLLSTPLSSAGFISNNWQSNFGFANKYGTNIYGPGAGYDAAPLITGNNSLLFWNANGGTVGAWEPVANTNATASTNNFIFVRGDKSVAQGVGNTWNTDGTTLGNRGAVITGTQIVNFTASSGGRFAIVGNPYLNSVNTNLLAYSGIAGTNAVYVWRTSAGTGSWVTIPGGTDEHIQSGSAFMVQLTGTTGSVTFEEADKTATQITTTTGAGNGLRDMLKTTLNVVNTGGVKQPIDYFYNFYGAGYKAGYDIIEDAAKMFNSEENLFSTRDGKKLSVEYKPYVQNADSIFLNLTNGKIGVNYELNFTPQNFDATVTEAKLVDKFLNTETPISLTGNSEIPFTITTATGSNAADRFMIVFRGTDNLPNKSLNVSAVKQTASVQVNWEATYEVGIKQYELEFSPNGTNFTSINTQNAKNGAITHNYTFNHTNPVNGVNYYRIKVTNQNDVVSYSNIITINLKSPTTTPITVYPNPVKGQTIGLQLTGIDKGEYDLRLVNAAGQTVYTQSIQVQGSMSMQITTNKVLAKGNYTLQIINNKGTQYSQQVLVVE